MTDNIFGKNLADCRKSAGLSRKELAAKINVNEMTVGNYERGDREPTLDKLIQLAEIFKTSSDFLLTGKTKVACRTVMGESVKVRLVIANDKKTVENEISEIISTESDENFSLHDIKFSSDSQKFSVLLIFSR